MTVAFTRTHTLQDEGDCWSLSEEGEAREVDLDLGAPPFAEGLAQGISIACLPLAEDFHTTFRAMAHGADRVQILHVVVLSQEALTVPAGSFRAWKVEISCPGEVADRLLLWVDPLIPRVVKSLESGPRFAGGSLSLELVK